MAKDDNDNDNPGLLKWVVQFTKPNYLFTIDIVFGLLFLSLFVAPDNIFPKGVAATKINKNSGRELCSGK